MNEGLIVLIAVAAYLAVCALLYFILRLRCSRDPVFRMPRSAFAFYFLSLTWGCAMTAVGAIVALVLLVAGVRARRYGRIIVFEPEKIRWGVSFGMFAIVGKPCGDLTKAHEHGHAVQNIYLGPFMPFIVSVPSAVRFWTRAFRTGVRKKRPRTDYDGIWFEGSATATGRALMKSLPLGRPGNM